jgi:predicted RNase H-like nuclease (RuvC/YqgF family)
MENSRKALLDDFERVTELRGRTTSTRNLPETNTDIATSKTAGDIQVITKAMEKLVGDIIFLKKENIILKQQIAVMQQEHQQMKDQLADIKHSVGADQNLHDWQVDAAGEDAMEGPISNTELIRKLDDMEQRRRNAGMH